MTTRVDEARERLRFAFPARTDPPPRSLRAGNALDDYAVPPDFDAELDRPTDAYIEAYYHGLFFLDAESFVFYLPLVLDYGLTHPESDSNAVDTLLFAMQAGGPPEASCPPLRGEQERAVVFALEALRDLTGDVFADEIESALRGDWRS